MTNAGRAIFPSVGARPPRAVGSGDLVIARDRMVAKKAEKKPYR
jgi:hypothetical protein